MGFLEGNQLMAVAASVGATVDGLPLGRIRGTHLAAPPGNEVACNSDIKSQRIYTLQKPKIFVSNNNNLQREDGRENRLLKVHKGITFVTDVTRKEDIPGRAMGNRGIKKKITRFSKRSRLNLIKHLAMMSARPEILYELTYSDDVMEGLSIEEKAKKSSEHIRMLKQWADRLGIKIQGYWKREWKRRKSGKLKGEWIPHFHFMQFIGGINYRSHELIFYRTGEKWIEITGTKGEYREKAIRVMYHEKSHRQIGSQKSMRRYFQKSYFSKDDELPETEDGIGRSWGKVGDPVQSDPEEIEVNADEVVAIKRMIRKLCKGVNKKVKYGLNYCLKNVNTKFFVLMEEVTMFRMLEMIRSGTIVDGVPF